MRLESHGKLIAYEYCGLADNKMDILGKVTSLKNVETKVKRHSQMTSASRKKYQEEKNELKMLIQGSRWHFPREGVTKTRVKAVRSTLGRGKKAELNHDIIN